MGEMQVRVVCLSFVNLKESGKQSSECRWDLTVSQIFKWKRHFCISCSVASFILDAELLCSCVVDFLFEVELLVCFRLRSRLDFLQNT